jgi:hypothetical protein
MSYAVKAKIGYREEAMSCNSCINFTSTTRQLKSQFSDEVYEKHSNLICFKNNIRINRYGWCRFYQERVKMSKEELEKRADTMLSLSNNKNGKKW